MLKVYTIRYTIRRALWRINREDSRRRAEAISNPMRYLMSIVACKTLG